jgi:hypothetical protein
VPYQLLTAVIVPRLIAWVPTQFVGEASLGIAGG